MMRWQDSEFRDGFSAALQHAAQSPHLQASGWFKLEYLLRNDSNWRKLTDGTFAGFDHDIRRQQQKNSAPDKTAVLSLLMALIRRYGHTGWQEADAEMTPLFKRIVKEMGRWGYVCGLTTKNIEIGFYRAWKKVVVAPQQSMGKQAGME